MSWIDIALIVLVVLCGLIGLWRGFKKSLLSLGAFIIAFVLAFFLANVIAEALCGLDAVKSFVLGTGEFGTEVSLANLIYQGLKKNSVSTASFLGENYFAPILEIIGKSTVDIAPDQGLAMYMAFLAFSALIGVGIFLIVRFLLMIVTAIIKSYIGKKKSIGSRLFGFLISAVQGAVIAFVITIVFSCFGGMSFMSAIGAVENEYESQNAVVATQMYKGAYAVRNSLFLPDEGLYGRIVNLVVKKDYEDPDTEMLTGDRLKLYIDIQNLNYKNEPWSIDETTKKRTFDSENAVAYKASDYTRIGYDKVLTAILAKNTEWAALVDDTEHLVDGSWQEFIMLVSDIGNRIDDIILKLNAYIADYEYSLKVTDEFELATCDLTLAGDYKTINESLDELKAKYDSVKTWFGDAPDFQSLIPERLKAGEGEIDQPDPPEQGDEGEIVPPEDGDEGENDGGNNGENDNEQE